MAKWLLGEIRLLVLEEPTRGMDVGAKIEIMKLVRELKENGASVIIASSEPELLLAHCDRIMVMRRGRVSAELVDLEADKRTLLRHAA
jgi:ABC-type sugar transport system ATPase subunit